MVVKQTHIGSGLRFNPYQWLNFNETAAETIAVPEWVPDHVADLIFLLSRRAPRVPGRFDCLMRLANDTNLEIVWDEIFKTRRENYKTTDDYLHPVRANEKYLLREYLALRDHYVEILRNERRSLDAERLASSFPSTNSGIPNSQQLAAAYLFSALLYYAEDTHRPLVTTAKRLATDQKQVVPLIRDLKVSASKLRKLGLKKEAEQVDAILARCEKHLHQLKDIYIVLGRGKGNLQVRGCVVHFGELMHELFGKRLKGCVERLVHCALPDQDVKNVNAIIRNHFPPSAN